MMGNMFEFRAGEASRDAERREQEMLQKAIEESRREADPSQVNPDNMTYEQLLELQESNGGDVSRGLTPAEIMRIPQKVWRSKTDTAKSADQCTVCYDNFKYGEKVKELANCKHTYHSKCIDKWLQNEKRCPVCNKMV